MLHILLIINRSIEYMALNQNTSVSGRIIPCYMANHHVIWSMFVLNGNVPAKHCLNVIQ